MAFIVERYISRQPMIQYDGTNGTDIIEHDWAISDGHGATLTSEEDGVLKFNWGGQFYGADYVLRIGDRLLLGSDLSQPGSVVPFEDFDDHWILSPDE